MKTLWLKIPSKCFWKALFSLSTLPSLVWSQSESIPQQITTPAHFETRNGSLDFEDGVPSAETAQTTYDTLDLIRGVDVFLNSFRGASAYAIRKGFHSIGAEDNTVVIFSDLMDANSLFLTANADKDLCRIVGFMLPILRQIMFYMLVDHFYRITIQNLPWRV